MDQAANQDIQALHERMLRKQLWVIILKRVAPVRRGEEASQGASRASDIAREARGHVRCRTGHGAGRERGGIRIDHYPGSRQR